MAHLAEFGPSVGLTQVDGAISDTLKAWLPTYLTAQERAWGYLPHWLKRPRAASYVSAIEEIESMPDAALPAIVVITPGTADVPQRDGNGNYSADYRVVVYAFVRGANAAASRLQADMFAAAIVRLLLQKAQDNDLIAEIAIDAIAVDPVEDDTSASRNLAVGVAIFTVVVESIVNDLGGPADPDPPDDDTTEYDPYPQVTSVDIDVTAIPVNQD